MPIRYYCDLCDKHITGDPRKFDDERGHAFDCLCDSCFQRLANAVQTAIDICKTVVKDRDFLERNVGARND